MKKSLIHSRPKTSSKIRSRFSAVSNRRSERKGNFFSFHIIIKVIAAAITLTVIVMIIGSFVRGFREPVVYIDDDELIVKSSYGVTIAKSEIYSARLIYEIPTLTRGSGFGVGNTQKGHVSVSNLGEGLAYVKVPGPPYIFLELLSINNYVFLNLHDADDTRKLYENIQAWLQT